VVTAEGSLYDSEAEFVVLPAADGEIGILPRHSPLVAVLKAGPLRTTSGGDEEIFFVSGGFADVARDGEDTTVTVLADSGERAHDIDEAAAEESRRRAQEILAQRVSAEEYAEAAGLLEHSVQRIRVAEIARRRRGRERPMGR
jgi:F-type H+-transporting ATPase subunit epsilon